MNQQGASVIDQLRLDTSAAMDNRRYIAALSSLGLLDFSLMTLFQIGALRRLPDLPLPFVTSEKIISSKDAAIYGLPDAVIALNLYAANLLLIALASVRKKESGIYDLLLGGVVAGNAAGSLYFLLNMIFKQKKACIYCVAGALISFTSLKPILKLLRGKKKI
jgi:uncharacterized membrane protein